MQKIFFKRFLRYMRENIAILLSFFALITVVSIVIVSVQCSSRTVIDGRSSNADTERIEDGQFTEFIPLSQSVIDKLCADYDVEIQPIFSFDLINDSGSTIRVYKNRTRIDIPVLMDGRLPESMGEVVIDQLYAEKNDLSVSDTIYLGSRPYTISGLACVGDYVHLNNKLTDASVDYNHFTWAIVSDDDFEAIVKADNPAVTYTYDYILSEDTDFNAFKGALTTLEFDYKAYAESNEYFAAYLDDRISQYFAVDELMSGIDAMVTGAETLSEGLAEVDSYRNTIQDGLDEVQQALTELDEGGRELSSHNDEINEGIGTIYSEYNSVYKKFTKIKDQILETSGQVKDESQKLSETINNAQLQAELDKLLSYIDTLEKQINDTDEQLLEYKYELKDFRNGLAEYTEGVGRLSEGISQLRSGVENFDAKIREYLDGISALNEGAATLSNGLVRFKAYIESQIEDTIKASVSNTVSIVTAEDNQRIGKDVYYANIYYKFSFILAPLLIGLFTLVFAIITKQQISGETHTIGALFALGVGKNLMMLFYLVPTLMVTLLGGIAGYLIGSSDLFVGLLMSAYHHSQSLPYYEQAYPLASLICAILTPVLVSLIVNYILLNKTFSRTALSLMRGEEPRQFYSKLKLKRFDFIRRFRIRQIINDTAIGIAVVICICISMVFLLMGIDTHVMIENGKAQTDKYMTYNYIYSMQYPMSTLETTGEKVYIETLKADKNGSGISVSVVGIESGNRFIDASPEQNAYSAVAGSGLASKMNLEVGDYLVLFDTGEEKNFAFRITDIVDSASTLQLYMDISSMRTLFGQTSGYYNAIISETELDIDSNLVYSVTTKESIVSSFDTQYNSMVSFIYISISAAVAIYLVVLYLIVGMLVDRNALGISLTRVLGYRGKEIRSLYIQGSSYIVVGALLISIPLGKAISNRISESAYSVIAVGMDLSFPWYYYPAIIAASLGAFAIILKLVIYKIRQINNTDILRSRL